MVSKKKLLLLCLLQYLLILGYHIIYSILYCTKDQTINISVWSICILTILVFFGYIFQKQIDLVVYVTMFSVLITVSYVGYSLSTLAYGVLIFFASGLILSMFIKPIYVFVWGCASTFTLIGYTVVVPDMILEMVPSIFLYYGYILCYLVGNICVYVLAASASKYFETLTNESVELEEQNLKMNYFWSNISHEIRTPMNVINGMSRLLKGENLNVRAKEYTDQIENASNMLLTIINDTVELSNVESASFKPNNEPYDIYRVASMSIMYASASLSNKNTNLAYCISPDVPSALIGDSDIITKVLVRLLRNAMLFTDQGEIKLEISSLRVPASDYVELELKVADEGGGVGEEDLKKMFIGFEDQHTTRSTELETVGLSLKLCRSMIEVLGGQISVSSQLGKGTCFSIKLKQKLSSTDVLSKEYEMYLSSANSVKFPEAKVLVVDDTPTNLKLISGMIRLHGIEPDNAESGKECIAMMEKKHYDLIFLDYMMPELDGLDVLKLIKQREEYNFTDVSIVALTSKSFQRDRNRFIEYGFDEFISKPIDDRELEDILRKFLTKENNQNDTL